MNYFVFRLLRISFLILYLTPFAKANSEDTLKEERQVYYKLDLFRAVQGTIQLTREQLITDRISYAVGLIGTYASTRGLAKPYLTSQEFTYKDNITKVTYQLSNVQAIGYGINLQLRNYLEKTTIKGRGYYIAPELFYRKLFLESLVVDATSLQDKTLKRNLNLGYVGYSFGYQRVWHDVVSFDTYIGGGLFLSKYMDETQLTKYRNAYQIDFTGFYMNMGVLIGVLR